MFLGSRKFLGMGGFASITAQAVFAGSTGSGIKSIGVGYELKIDNLTDPSGHFDGFINPAEDVDHPTVNFLKSGRTLTIDLVSAQVQYQAVENDGPFGGLYDEVNVILYYARLGDYFNDPAPANIQNQITITSTATPTYVVSGGTRIYTNNFSTYNVSIQELAYNQNNQSTYPIRWITRKTISTTDKDAINNNTGFGLIGVYNVIGRGSPTAGSISINVREGSA
jgi:hypothetical protein